MSEIETTDTTGEDAVETPAAEPEVETPLAEVETPEPETPEVEETAAAPAIDWESPEARAAVAQHSQAYIDDLLARAEAQAARQPQPEAETTEPQPLPDPLEDPQGFGEGLLGQVEDRIGQMLAPLLQAHEQQALGAATEQVSEFMGSLPEVTEAQKLLGETDDAMDAAALAETFGLSVLDNALQTYGDETPAARQRAVQAAGKFGAETLLKLVKTVHKAGYEARTAELHTIANAGEEPGGTTGATDLSTLPEDPKEALEEARKRWLAREQSS